MAKLFANSGSPDQTMHILWQLVWVCTVCQLYPFGCIQTKIGKRSADDITVDSRNLDLAYLA